MECNNYNVHVVILLYIYGWIKGDIVSTYKFHHDNWLETFDMKTVIDRFQFIFVKLIALYRESRPEICIEFQ